MKRLVLLLLLISTPVLALAGCEELGFSKKKGRYPSTNSAGDDAGMSESEGGPPAGPLPTITAQPGDIQI